MDIDEIKSQAISAIALDKLSSDSTKYVEFAQSLIDNGIESENIFILLGLEKDSYYDKIQYFNKVLSDLNIEIENSEKIDVLYAKSIAKQVVKGKLDPIESVIALEKLYLQNDDEHFYFEFLEISDGIDLFRDGYDLVQGMREDNYRDYVKHLFELFLIFSELTLPEDFYKQGYCKKCLKRFLPKLRTKKNGIFGKKYTINICPECSGEDFYWTRYNTGKDLYLKEIRLTTAST